MLLISNKGTDDPLGETKSAVKNQKGIFSSSENVIFSRKHASMPPVSLEEAAPAAAAQAAGQKPPPQQQPVGIIYPPPEVRNIVDKTAAFVARNGLEFEQRIKQNEVNNPKFNFLSPGDPYHAYYQHRVTEIREGKDEAKQEKKAEKEKEKAEKGAKAAAAGGGQTTAATEAMKKKQAELLKQAQKEVEPPPPTEPPPGKKISLLFLE